MSFIGKAWDLAKRSVKSWVDDTAASMGAAVAFYALFSLAPLLLVAVALAGFFLGEDVAQGLVLEQVRNIVGPSAALGIESLLQAAGGRKEGLIAVAIGTITVLVGATTVFAELRSALDRIWRHEPGKAGGLARLIKVRLLSFAIVMGVGILLLASVAASTCLAALAERWFPESRFLVGALEFVLSFIAITGLFAMIYKILPSPRIAWGDVWVGAAVTSVLFWIGKWLIAFYLAHAAVASSFGAAGTVVALIVWVYYSAQVFFLGAEFTRQYALTHGSRSNGPVSAS